eukprot:GHVU01138790.1.p2 GENE.GHVU01138790.1~~GHVU01138790.1.p2  ORF type:complete len:122 (+),score=13.85 GHVU01138790.1:546-911(+)
MNDPKWQKGTTKKGGIIEFKIPKEKMADFVSPTQLLNWMGSEEKEVYDLDSGTNKATFVKVDRAQYLSWALVGDWNENDLLKASAGKPQQQSRFYRVLRFDQTDFSSIHFGLHAPCFMCSV